MGKIDFSEEIENSLAEVCTAVSRFKELTKGRISRGQELVAQASFINAQANYINALVDLERFKLKNGKKRKKSKKR